MSFLTLPSFTGIRDIPNLVQATRRNSVTCYSFNNNFSQLYLQSDVDSLMSIGKCLQRNDMIQGEAEESFVRAPPVKAFRSSRLYLESYKQNYLISEDSFMTIMYALRTSRNFSCKRYHLNKMIHRLTAAGVLDKLYRDEALQFQLKSLNAYSNGPDAIKPLQIRDLKGSFWVLLFGDTLSSAVFFVQKTVKYIFTDKRLF